MPFLPDNITREHVLQGLSLLLQNQDVISPSTGYDVIINNKPYPPKEVMRYAHQVMNGEHIWERSGGEPTNKYLKALGFQIVDKKTTESPKTTMKVAEIKSLQFSKNTILYGPPGTGKTYNSINLAVQIVTGDFESNYQTNKALFDDLNKLGQIEFVTFHPNYTYEDFVVGITPDITVGHLRFEKREGIFKQMVERAKENWLASIPNKKAKPDFKKLFNTFFEKLIQEEVSEIAIPMKAKNYSFKITNIDIEGGKIKFTKQSGGNGHDLLIKNLKAIYEGDLDYGPEGLGVYYYPLVDKLKKFEEEEYKMAKEPNTKLKNYVLIIDEINRANIARVFGELITLIETDKRLGSPNELKLTLPNGERDFGVPPNLYIIGTMNTADKSIALIDIALRRRFDFVGYYPNYELCNNENSLLLQTINAALYKEKRSADFLIGHAYFMGDMDTRQIIIQKVIPLLMEYFSGKTELVSNIFSNTNWQVEYNSTNFKWDVTLK